MPARIVFVHDDPAFTEPAASALGAAGHTVAAFTDPMQALNALEAAREAELLITRIDFGPGKINGIALARMARFRRRGIRVLFMAPSGMEKHAAGLGELLPQPTDVADLIEAAGRLLQPLGQSPML